MTNQALVSNLRAYTPGLLFRYPELPISSASALEYHRGSREPGGRFLLQPRSLKVKNVFSIAALSTVVLALAACSGSTQATEATTAPATSSVHPSATSAPAASPSAPASTVPSPVGPSSPAPSSPAVAASPTTEPSATPLVDLGLNERGNLTQKVGVTSVFGAPTGQQFADLTADSVQTDFQCTTPDAKASVNGQFVAIKISVAAKSNFEDSGWPSLALSNLEFTAWDAAGVKLMDPVGNSAGCVPDAELIASPIEPGTNATGLVILDVPKGAGSAAFVVGGFEGSYGWEWHW